jgi:hypothetical protein
MTRNSHLPLAAIALAHQAFLVKRFTGKRVLLPPR